MIHPLEIPHHSTKRLNFWNKETPLFAAGGSQFCRAPLLHGVHLTGVVWGVLWINLLVFHKASPGYFLTVIWILPLEFQWELHSLWLFVPLKTLSKTHYLLDISDFQCNVVWKSLSKELCCVSPGKISCPWEHFPAGTQAGRDTSVDLIPGTTPTVHSFGHRHACPVMPAVVKYSHETQVSKEDAATWKCCWRIRVSSQHKYPVYFWVKFKYQYIRRMWHWVENTVMVWLIKPVTFLFWLNQGLWFTSCFDVLERPGGY